MLSFLALLLLLLPFASFDELQATPIEDRLKDEDPVSLDPARVNWRQLDFKATKLFLSARTEVTFEEVEQGVGEISFATKVLGRETSDAIRFQLDDADTLSRRKQKHGSNPYAKLYRFSGGAVSMERSEPADVDEATDKPSTWSHRRTETFAPPPGACGRVVDPSVVLYLAAARPWGASDGRYTVCAFSDGRFSRLVLELAGEEEIRVEYDVVQPDGSVVRRDETVKALLLTLDAESLLGAGKDQLEVLGLEEDVRMYVDPQTGAPLRFTGKMDTLGSVEVELERLVLR